MTSFQFFINLCGHAFIIQIIIIIGLEIVHFWNAHLQRRYQRSNIKQMLEFESALRDIRERLAKEGKTPEEIREEMLPGKPSMEDIKKKFGHLFEDQLKPKE